jgi:hypothetical protein
MPVLIIGISQQKYPKEVFFLRNLLMGQFLLAVKRKGSVM